MRHLLRDDDLAPAEQAEVLALAHEVKRDPYARQPLAGPRTVAVIFDRNSTRTRVSFAAGIAALGGHPLLMDAGTTQAGRGEPVADLARVLGRMTAAAVWRTAHQSDLAELAAHAGIPVVNALTDAFHPCQLLADLMTIQEHKGELTGLSVAFLGDGACNVARSTLLAGALAGMHVRVAAPEGHQPAPEIVDDAARWAERTGGSVLVVDDPEAAVSGVDVLMTDTWVSMGRETERNARIAAFGRFGVTTDLVALADDEVVVLHCLPAYRGLEITAEVLDGPRSVVWDQAENRLHAQQALLIWLLERVGEEER